MDGTLGVWFARAVRGLPLWLGGGHDDIVALALERELNRENASVEQVVRV